MEQDKKYYIPEVEELHENYRCEIYDQASTKLMKDARWHPVVVNTSTNEIGLCVAMNRVKQLLRNNHLRTKYLDREDIESLGWELWRVVDKAMGRDSESFTLGNWMMGYNYDTHTIGILILDPSKELDYPNNCGTYRGECKSINELRTLMKWLKIK